jgi:hypothetical protein
MLDGVFVFDWSKNLDFNLRFEGGGRGGGSSVSIVYLRCLSVVGPSTAAARPLIRAFIISYAPHSTITISQTQTYKSIYILPN